MAIVNLKTHLIISDMHEEYFVKWTGKMSNVKPLIRNGLPVFVVVGSDGRIELNTLDIKDIEKTAKSLTHPRGREAFTTDYARIYIVEEDETETLMGKVTHNHIKQYQQMFDKFETIYCGIEVMVA